MSRTAGEAGWHKSRYNIGAPIPDTREYVMVNLFTGTCGSYSQLEMFLYEQVEGLDENHPIIERFARRGLIVNFDELEVMKTLGRMETASLHQETITVAVCPTTGCNFNCPYCYENHNTGFMTPQVQDETVQLVEKLLNAYTCRELNITWYGGEPLLGPEIIEALSDRFIALCERRGIRYNANIITNGYLLTQPIADLLGRCRVSGAQITLDGIGPVHDRTRPLAGGGPTFDRITRNLRTLKLPFRVQIRHNLHMSNYDQAEPLSRLVAEIAEESGNRLICYSTPVTDSYAARERGSTVQTLRDQVAVDMSIRYRLQSPIGFQRTYCLANCMSCVNIDEKGNLYRCQEQVDDPTCSFGTAARWDPADPIATADRPDLLTRYINAALPLEDSECRDCVWLPLCVGGCPKMRLYYEKECVAYKEAPGAFALALYRMYRDQSTNAGDT